METHGRPEPHGFILAVAWFVEVSALSETWLRFVGALNGKETAYIALESWDMVGGGR